MKEILQQYAAYHLWANQTITTSILKLDDTLHKKVVPGSFPHLYATILHMWDAESSWWQRLKLQEKIQLPSEKSNRSIQDVISGLVQQNQLWVEWINHATPAALEHVFAYQNSKKEQYKQPVFQMILHVFNHGTYHRGQLVMMLRLLGEDKIPATDFIVWSRKK
jgi:uncharacterized damage-inducible protein DinB